MATRIFRSKFFPFALMAGVLLAAHLLLAGHASGAKDAGSRGRVMFWLAGFPQQIDAQVAALMKPHAAMVVLRMRGDDQQQAGAAPVKRLKRVMPDTPVLMYTWASRNKRGTPGSAGILDWVDNDPEQMQIQPPGKPALKSMMSKLGGKSSKSKRANKRAHKFAPGDDQYGNVTKPEFRSRLASSIAAAVQRGGFDGVALDLAIRTPRYRPGALAKRCRQDSNFCTRYADGMDKTFTALRAALGNRPILYNGLWNFGPGMVDDQVKLLDQADAANIEYFGRRPQPEAHRFSHDILPYLKAMTQVPGNKKIFAHGRGSWQYGDYAEDYAWQRYLYCAYLLAARANIHFRYDASSQLDMRLGRTGPLSIYADWLVDLGEPTGAYRVSNGLYSRSFANGLVVVAPDDGDGGTYALPGVFYSPEGEKYEGSVALKPAQALLLLARRQAVPNRDDVLDVGLLTDWPGASLKNGVLSLQATGPVGSHDMLLDHVRSLHPRNLLQLQLRVGDGARLKAVAEVDDSEHQYQYAVLDVGLVDGGVSSAPVDPVVFRSHASGRQERWPAVGAAKLTAGQWQDLELDGRALFAGKRLKFQRWSHVRFEGAIDLKSVRLSD